MKMDDMILVSVDDHISEPADMFAQHAPAKLKGQFPKAVRKDDGSDVWTFEGKEILNVGLNAVVGRPLEEYGMEPTSYDQMRKGCYDVDARIDDMNVNGLLAGLNFGSFVGTTGNLFCDAEDKKLALAVLQAYNDWHIDEWCGAYPGRFIPLALVPLWDAKLAAEEARRVKKKGCNAISFPPAPAKAGMPSFHQGGWDMLWEACNDEGIVVCMHIGDLSAGISGMDSPIDALFANMPVSLFQTASDLVFSPVLRKYDNLKFALSEGGIGWIPHFMDRIDYVYNHHHQWTNQDFGGKMPSEVFLEHCYTCFIDDPTGIRDRYQVGIDNMTWECDYPHSDCIWPNAPELVWDRMGDIPEEDIHKITWQNACRLFDFDPIANFARDECTVGALRAQAKHVDTSYTETKGAGLKPTSKKGAPVSIADITYQLSNAFGGKETGA